MGNKKDSSVEKILYLLYFLLPLCIIIFGAYFFYFRIYQRNLINNTVEDIIHFNNGIKLSFGENYKGINTDTIVFNNILPLDMSVQKTNNTHVLKNRFGGHILFYEAFYTQSERNLFLGLMNDQENYDNMARQISAFIILYTGLSQSTCRALATTPWKNHTDNFVGMELSHLDINSRYNGVFNLKLQLLDTPDNIEIKTKDAGFIFDNIPTQKQAKQACNCRGKTCTFAIKFN